MSRGAFVDVHQIGQGETGNETWARNLVEVLEADAMEPLDFGVTGPGLVDVDPARVHLLPGSSAARLLVDLPRALRRLRSSAVLTQYTLPVSRTPGVVVIHDVSFLAPEAGQWLSPATRLRYAATIGASARRARVVVAPTSYTRDRLVEHYRLDPAKVLVAPLAVDRRLGRLINQAERPDASRQRVVLCVGTLLPRKNLPIVARSVGRLGAGGRDVRLRLVGPVRSGGQADLALMRQVLGDALEVVGVVSQEQLVQEYLRADVLAFPSRYEGFGLPVLEAMAAGTPVVCSSATCLPEVVGDAAVLVDPLDELAWVAGLGAVLEDPQQLGAQGRARAAAFTWEATGAVVRDALDRAVG